ncbi:MAG: EAL domain-containing protein [bacterium]|nr:EAL domain-containing protein [bacterium]
MPRVALRHLRHPEVPTSRVETVSNFQHRTARSIAGLSTAVACFFTLCAPAFAQRLPIHNFGIADGLEVTYLQAVMEDERGLLWIGHSRGLTTFDGRTFEDVTLPPQMTEVDIGAVELDGGGGFCAVAQWTPVRVMCSDSNGWSLLPVLSVESDAPERVQAIAAIATEYGLRTAVLLHDHDVKVFSGGEWHDLTHPESLRFNDITSFGSEFRLASDRGLFRIDDETTNAVRIGNDHRTVLALSREPVRKSGIRQPMWVLGAGWIGSFQDDVLVTVHDTLELTSVEWPTQSAVIGAHQADGVYFGTSTGLAFLDLARGEITPIGRAEGMAGEGVNDLLVDSSGQAWVAGYRSLAVITTRQFGNYGSLQGLIGDEVASVLELSPGRVLLGQDTGLTLLESGKVRSLALESGPAWAGTRPRVMELTKGPDGTIWAAAYHLGFLQISIDPKISVVDSIASEFGAAFSIQIDANGRFWAVAGAHLFTRESDTDQFEPVPLDRPTSGVRRVVLGPNGTIYVLTDSDLIYGNPGAWIRVSGAEGRESNNFYSVWPLDAHRAWIGTAAGLFELDHGELRRVILGGSAIDRPVYAIVVDKDSKLWCGTDDGVFVWDGESLRHRSARHGMSGGDVNRSALICDSHGDIWIGTDGGVTHYRGSFEPNRPAAPFTELLGLEADGDFFTVGEDRRLAQGINDLSFRFRTINLHQGEQPLFQCRLEGYDADWSRPRQFVGSEYRYTNLPSGSYRFSVRSGWEGGPWGPPAVSGEFVVRPPLWRSLSSLATITALIFAALIALLRRAYVKSHDPLTKLLNRRSFYTRLERAFARAERTTDRHVAVLLLDLDRFKLVNQSLGRTAGRRLLQEVASRLRKTAPPSGVLARLDGDDFAVLLDRVSSPDQAMEIAHRLQGAVSSPLVISGQEVFSTASIGVALGGKGYRWGTNLLRDADIALQHARAGGLGQIVAFDAAMRRRVFNQLRLESDLRRAIDRQEFELMFQPIVGLDNLEVLALEALLRWRHPVSGLLQPAEFLVAAEETGLIVDIGAWVIEEGLRTMQRWKSTVFAGTPVALHVNLSPRQFEPGDLPDRVARALRETGVEGSSLVLEITERLLAEPTTKLLDQTHALRANKIRLSIDDFGVGHSSLGYLRDLPVDQIKLDRSFVARTTPEGEELKIVETILALGRELELDVVVEGVEQLWQHEWLLSHGCRSAQGYLYSRPLPTDRFASANSAAELLNSLDSSAAGALAVR